MGDTIPLQLEKDSAFEKGSAHWPMCDTLRVETKS
jgi:hypothetical protein